ncbi:MAG: HEAT repeat domain-containing protein [Myxococcota bacterium]
MARSHAVLWLLSGLFCASLANAQTGAESVPDQDGTYIKGLISALQEDDSYKIRLQAAVFLGRSNDPRAVEPLLGVLTKDKHYTVRAAAATALANLDEPKAIEPIIVLAAADPDEFVREEAQRALDTYDRATVMRQVVATYRHYIDGAAKDTVTAVAVRRTVIDYLMSGDFTAGEPVFTEALGDVPDIFAEVRKVVLLQPEAVQLRFLQASVDHSEPSVRRGAVEVLRSVGTKHATEIILQVYDRELEVDQVRKATYTALRELRRFLPLDTIADSALKNADRYARARSIKLLGVIGGDEAKQVLLKNLQADEPYFRGTAVNALKTLGDPSTIPALEALLTEPANERLKLQIHSTIKELRGGGAP